MLSWLIRLAFAAIAAVIAGIAAYHLMQGALPEISRAEFMDEVRAAHVQRIEIEDQQVILGESTSRGKFFTRFDRRKDAGLPEQLRALGIEIRYSSSPPSP